MNRICWLVCGAMLSGCMHSAPAEVKKEVLPVFAVPEVTPQLTAALVERVIVKGTTTKKEIVAALGSPISVDQNKHQLSRELLKTIKVPLPPIARTKEFWKFQSNPFLGDGGKYDSTVFNLLVFFDDDDVAVDYMTENTKVDIP